MKKPKIFVYVEGGVVQGISSDTEIEVYLFDKDNYMDDDSLFEENYNYFQDKIKEVGEENLKIIY